MDPYTVIKVEGESIDVVDDEGKQIPKINIDHLIQFLEDHRPKGIQRDGTSCGIFICKVPIHFFPTNFITNKKSSRTTVYNHSTQMQVKTQVINYEAYHGQKRFHVWKCQLFCFKEEKENT